MQVFPTYVGQKLGIVGTLGDAQLEHVQFLGSDGIEDGDDVEIDIRTGEISNATRGTVIQAEPLPGFIQRIVDKGGLINFLRDEGYA